MTEDKCPVCGERLTHRDDKEHREFINRLNRIEGQIRGIKKMVEEDRYCIDIINQVSAASSALHSFNKVLLSAHIRSCVVKDVEDGSHQMVDELCDTLQKLMK